MMDAGNDKTSVLVIDDDELALSLIEAVLKKAGFSVQTMTDSENALRTIEQMRPDVILSDLMMPKTDGFDLCQSVCENEELDATKFIVVSAKAYASDEARALELGADGFIRKPINPETFADSLLAIINDQVSMTFWGVRGTLPKTGKGALKYGGNTSCVTLEFPNQQLFIFDGGSGIKELGNRLIADKKRRINAKLFISHPHWDHINAIPFFAPLYKQGNEFEILGAKQGDITMRELISAQMDGVYFPITLTEFSARTYFRNLEEGTHDVAGIEVQTKLLAHPGRALGYRVNYNGRSICYITDQELYLEDSDFFDQHYEKTIVEFIKDADVLITDSTYSDEEYKTKVNWGHSCISKVCEIAHRGNVKNLYLFHHDPDQDDNAIDAKYEAACADLEKLGSAVTCIAPKEGDQFRL